MVVSCCCWVYQLLEKSWKKAFFTQAFLSLYLSFSLKPPASTVQCVVLYTHIPIITRINYIQQEVWCVNLSLLDFWIWILTLCVNRCDVKTAIFGCNNVSALSNKFRTFCENELYGGKVVFTTFSTCANQKLMFAVLKMIQSFELLNKFRTCSSFSNVLTELYFSYC